MNTKVDIKETVMNLQVVCKDIDAAWKSWYDIMKNIVLSNYKSIDSRDGEVAAEIINATTVIEDPTRCFLKSKIRNLPVRYAIGELLWYLSGNNSLEAIQLITNNWDNLSDDGETVNSNYGYVIQNEKGFNQFDYCYELLKKEPTTRQAIIHIKTPVNTLENPTKDLNCTVYCQFFIRDGKLHMITHMRSNDLWLGFPYDVFQFTCMQILMAMKLGVKLGKYTHVVDSLHLYMRDYEKAIEAESELEA